MKKFLIVSIAFVLSGCAAIRIDVDVYKGPLLNEQLVQQQQVVSMTLASKLILEAQRDDECKNQAHKVRCRLLNDAISLFDPVSSQYASLVKRAEESIGLYTSSIKRRKELGEQARRFKEANTSIAKGSAALTLLDYMGAIQRPPYVSTVTALLATRKAASQAVEAPLYASSKDLFSELNNRDVIDTILSEAKIQKEGSKDEFRSIVKRYVELTSEARQGLVQLTDAVILNEPLPMKENDAAASDKEMLQRTYLAIAIEARNFACAIEISKGAKEAQLLIDSLHEINNRSSLLPAPERSKSSWSTDKYQGAQIDLRRLMFKPNFVELVSAVKFVDLRFRNARPEDINKTCLSASTEKVGSGDSQEASDVQRMASDIARSAGIFSVALTNDSTNQLIKFLGDTGEKGLQRLLARLSGVRGGRTEKGIDELSADFIKAASQQTKGEPAPYFTELSIAIINLGEKLRYLSVNWWLVEDDAPSTAIANFKTVIEAVGNSLISQANEAVSKKSFDARMAAAGKVERDAIKEQFSEQADKALIKVVQLLKDKQLGEDAKQVTLSLEEQDKKQKVEAKKFLDASIKELLEKRLGAMIFSIGLDAKAPAYKEAESLFKYLNIDKSIGEHKEIYKELKIADQKNSKDLLAMLSLSRASAERSNKDSTRSAAIKAMEGFVKPMPGSNDGNGILMDAVTKEAALFVKDGTELFKKAEPEAKKKAEGVKGEVKAGPSVYSMAADLILKHQADFLKSDVANEVKDTSVFLNRLLNFLTIKDADGTTKEIAAAIKGVNFFVASVTANESPQKALEQLYATLSQEHIAVVAANGKESPRAVALGQALNIVNQRRSEFSYVRPAVSYLRSIHNTILSQSQSGLAWRNMLTDSVVKGTPLIGSNLWNISSGGAFARNPGTDAQKIVEDLDRSFWQTINSVKVNGTGRSNFVIAKDDVGNWYVKAMSSDPSQIFKSAKGLLLFNMGNRIDQNLLELNELREKRKSMAGVNTDDIDQQISRNQAESKEGTAGFQAVLTKYRDNYSKQLLADFDALKKLLSDKKPASDAIASVEKLGLAAQVSDPKTSDWDKTLTDQVVSELKSKLASFPGAEVMDGETASTDTRRAQLIGTGLTQMKAWVASSKIVIDDLKLTRALEVSAAIEKDKVSTKEAARDVAIQNFLSKPTDANAKTNYDDALKSLKEAKDAQQLADSKLTVRRSILSSFHSAINQVIVTGTVDPFIARRNASIKETEKAVLILSEAAE
jgi:hypothetical protein